MKCHNVEMWLSLKDSILLVTLKTGLNYNSLSIFEQMKSDRKCYIEGIRGS